MAQPGLRSFQRHFPRHSIRPVVCSHLSLGGESSDFGPSQASPEGVMATPGTTHFDLSESPMRWVRFPQSTHDEVTRMEQRPRRPDKRNKLRPAPPTLKRFRPARSVSSQISYCPSVLPFEEDVQIRTSPAEPFSKGSVPAQDREFVLEKCLLSLGCFISLNCSISFRLEGVRRC